MPRVLRIAVSLAIVLVAYWAYALIAVPLIEPPADPQRSEQISTLDREAVQKQLDLRVEGLRGLFPADAWELKNPKILEGDRVKLLMQEYRNLGDGRLELRPCTIVLVPDESVADRKQRERQAVVLEAPDGATVEFDKPFDLRSVKVGRLVGGKLNGRIIIRSKGKSPGPEDDLWIVTRDIELSERDVRTPHQVDFRLGPHHGRGREMHIKLLPGKKTAKGERRGPSIGGVELFEMRHVERLHLALGQLRSASAQSAERREQPIDAASDLPLEITCRGPFRLDVPGKVATFQDRVDVMRIHPVGPVDQLNCELLSIFLTERNSATPPDTQPGKGGSKEKQQAGASSLQPQRIEARGDPVILSAPTDQLHARGTRLEYDLAARRIVLDGNGEVMLSQGPNEIHARSLHYQSAGPGQLGRITAEGPGWLRGQIPNPRSTQKAAEASPIEPLAAQWNDVLRVHPHEQNQVISLSGGAKLTYGAIGQLSAREIHFRLFESPSDTKSDELQLRPDRMLARDDVRVNSPKLSGAVEQMKVWFEQADGDGVRQAVEGSGFRVQDSVSQDQAAVGNPSPTAQQHFDIAGRLLQARVRVGEGEQTKLSELIVEDGVRFVETRTAKPDERPMLISGDRLHVIDADTPAASAIVTGRPAHFEGRGLSLTGPNINLNRGTNRLWIDGPGRMNLPVDRDLDGRPLKKPDMLNVQWRRRMAFDGRTAQFDESVTAATTDRRLQTETLEVRFERPIRFGDSKIDQEPNVEQVLCRGGVLVENRTLDSQQLVSFEKMQLVDLAVNLTSGAMTAGGPGWLNSVRRGSADLMTGRAAKTVAPAAASGEKDDTLRCLHVRFQGSITGNLHARKMTFHDQVQTTYAPVESWQAMLSTNDPDALGPDGVVMHCDRLGVTQTITPNGGRRALELEAVGNTVVEGSTFTARAIRMTYAEAKDLLVLEGDGRTDAVLFRQEQLGGPMAKAAAQKILYWPKTKRAQVVGARSLDLENFRLPERMKQ